MSDNILESEQPVPSVVPLDRAVNWAVFRTRPAAERYLEHIQLGPGQDLIGGHGTDSIGEYWWVGVRVPSVAHWGSRQAVHKHARHGD